MVLDRDQAQAEKDLLASARETLERYCKALRYAHLYPKGPNDAVLIEAYQELMRLHRVGRVRWRGQRHKRRILRRIMRRHLRRDAIQRSRRLTYGFPTARPQPLQGEPPPVVWRALDDLGADAPDAADEVLKHIQGRSFEELEADASMASQSRVKPRFARGLDIFREKLINRALEDPDSIPGLHPQYVAFTRSALPLRRRYPIARLLLVKLPLYFWMSFILLFNCAYLGAYVFFNDATFGRFLGGAISSLIDGELEFGEAHWSPSLLLKLVTGQPAHVVAKDVTVWSAFKTTNHGKERVAAYAEELELDLVLHEIIPWNRMGIPEVLEIPWVLHFTHIESKSPVKITVEQYTDTLADGTEVMRISLVDAFKPAPREWPVLTTRRLSFQMDSLELPIELDLDLRAGSNWRLLLNLDRVRFDLDFLGLHPLEPVPVEKPLRYRVDGHATEGMVSILSLGNEGYHIPIQDLDLDAFTDGMDGVPLGDIRVLGAGIFAGSPAKIDGWLLSMFHADRAVDTSLDVADVGPLGTTILDAHGLPRKMVRARGAHAELRFTGLFTDPTIGVSTSGVTLDFFDDPELDWAIRDASLEVALHQERLPLRWDDHVLEADSGWIAEITQFEGDALGGHVGLHPFGDRNHIVVSTGQPGPMMMAFDMDLQGVNPAELVNDDAMIQRLSGSVDGRLEVPKLILKTGDDAGLALVELGLNPLTLERLNGPRDDGIPRSLRLEGGVTLEERRGLDLQDLRVTTDGALVEVSGGIDAEWKQLRPTNLHVRVSDGREFLSSYGLPAYFERLDTRLQLSGPVTSPDGRNGTLSVSGVGSGDYALSGVEQARLWMDRGVLKLRSPRVNMLGGHGPLKTDFWLFERGEVSRDPRLWLNLDLEDAEFSEVLGDAVKGKGEIHVKLGDGKDNAVPLSKFQVRGAVYSERLEIGVTPFHDASVGFEVTREGLDIRTLELAFHRRVSPYHAPDVTVRVGALTGKGSLSFGDDPALDFQLEAGGLPVSALVGMAGVESLPIGGQVLRGTELEVKGTLARPSVHGNVNLSAMSAAGIPLGSGKLVLDSRDCDAGLPCSERESASGDELLAASGLAARREVQVHGKLGGKRLAKDDPSRLDWTVDATVAIGALGKKRAGARASAPVSAEFTARFGHLPVGSLLRAADPRLRDNLIGQFEDLAVSARLCAPGTKLLASCTEEEMSVSEWGLNPKLNLSLARLWLRSASSLPKSGRLGDEDPCEHAEALCSDPATPLVAELDGTRIHIREPWRLLTWDRGGPGRKRASQGGSGGGQPKADGDATFLDRATRRGQGRGQGQGQGKGRGTGKGGASRPLKMRALTVEGEIDLSAPPPREDDLPSEKVEAENAEQTGADKLAELAEQAEGAVTSAKAEKAEARSCTPPRSPQADPLSDAVARLAGELALGGVSGIAEAYGIENLRGRVGVNNVELKGPISAPVVTGSIDIPDENPPLRIGLGGDTPIQFRVPQLALRVVDNTVYVAGKASVGGQIVEFGELGGAPTFITITGGCAGEFGVAAQGEIDGELVSAQAPSVFKQASGTIDIRRLRLTGNAMEGDTIRTLHALLESGQQRSFNAEFAFAGLDPIELRRGPIELVRCSDADPCPGNLDGYGVFVGGVSAANAVAAPSTAMRVKMGTRGRATLWGYAVLPPDFSGLTASDLKLRFSNVRYTSYDNSGRPQLKTVLSSDGLALAGREQHAIRGDVDVVSAKWIRDAQQQLKVLSFEDPTPAPEAPPSEFLENLGLDLKVKTSSPARVDNNVMRGVEGHMQLAVTGTYGDMDMAGKIDVTTGVLDINILGVPYDIQRGKVLLKADMNESVVDILARRQEPIYIDRQPRQMYLELAGTLDRLEWRCIVQGDASGALSNYECAQYLVLGEGEQDAVESDVRRFGGGGLLGKPIALVGNLTKVSLGTYVDKNAPNVAPYLPEVALQLGQSGIEIDAQTPPRWFRSEWGAFSAGAGYTRGYPGLLLRQSANWRLRFQLLDNVSVEFRDSFRSYYNERIIFDPLRQRKLELKFDLQLPSI